METHTKLQPRGLKYEPLLLMPSAQKYFANFDAHKRLLSDRVRLEAFKKAINEVVRPGDVVLDIGAGTGILSKFAINAGAKKIYLIEENRNLLSKARANLAPYNNQTEIIYIAKRSTELKTSFIPEKADVIISETIGSLGINEGIIKTLSDAKRFLKSNGHMIPFQLLIKCSLYYDKSSNTCSNVLSKPHIRRDNSRSLSLATQPHNNISVINFKKDITKFIPLKLNPGKSLTKPNGIAIWFKARLSNSSYIETWPLWPQTSWGIAIFPIHVHDKTFTINLKYFSQKCFIDTVKSKIDFNQNKNIRTKNEEWDLSQVIFYNECAAIKLCIEAKA